MAGGGAPQNWPRGSICRPMPATVRTIGEAHRRHLGLSRLSRCSCCLVWTVTGNIRALPVQNASQRPSCSGYDPNVRDFLARAVPHEPPEQPAGGIVDHPKQIDLPPTAPQPIVVAGLPPHQLATAAPSQPPWVHLHHAATAGSPPSRPRPPSRQPAAP